MWVLEAVVTEAVHNTASLFAFRNEVMDSNPQSTRACNSNIPPEHLGTLHTMRLMEIRLLGSFGHCFATLDRFTVPLLCLKHAWRTVQHLNRSSKQMVQYLGAGHFWCHLQKPQLCQTFRGPAFGRQNTTWIYRLPRPSHADASPQNDSFEVGNLLRKYSHSWGRQGTSQI